MGGAVLLPVGEKQGSHGEETAAVSAMTTVRSLGLLFTIVGSLFGQPAGWSTVSQGCCRMIRSNVRR